MDQEKSAPEHTAPQDKCGEDVAEREFERFLTAMDLEIEPKGMDDEDKKSFYACKERFITAVKRGSLIVNENGEPVFTPTKGDRKPITFYEPTGNSIMARDQKKPGHDVAKAMASLADMTRESIPRFTQMANRDFKVCEAIMLLFLA